MPHLTINLFGSPRIELDGVPVKNLPLRTVSLIAYLAISGVSQTRETIANFLWSDSDLPHALASLRTSLWRLKQAGLEDWIIVENNEISLNYQKPIEVDVVEFKEKVDRPKSHGHPPSQTCLYCIPFLTEAVELYHDDFMRGFYLSKAQAFDDWRLQEGETLRALYIDALERLVKGHRTFGDFNLAIHFVKTLLRQDRYNETALYDLLQLYLITGQRAAAITQYKRYKYLLINELGLQPSEEINALYKQILSGHAAPLVSKKVTTPVFLIADIDKSSSFWAQASTKKNALLSKYQDIFNETVRRFGGYMLQKSEDNVTLLFEKGQPLHCAVTIHLKLQKVDWDGIDPPNVRMVVYTSDTGGNGNNDFSMITRSASNLLSICWGGQIVFSSQTLQVLDQPPGSGIKDLGFHCIKDIKEPVHVYELLHPHLPAAEHLPLKSVTSQLVNFPSLIPVFIGRENELIELAELIEPPDNRIISLVGPGGVGKTRLAVQFAAQVASHFSDGVYFIPLASIQDPCLIPIVLADTLKFSFYGPRNQEEQLTDYLHRMNTLLVFDNFEHLRLEGSKFLAYLLSHTHYLKTLITSRERLYMLAESTMEVHGLPVPPLETTQEVTGFSSIRLFLHNAHRLNPRFSLEMNAPAIIRICQLVNGLPLGIILASSWVRVYSCPQIVEEIQNNIDFLDSSAPDLPPRHRSLRAVFDHSWALLFEEERNILRRLSLFRAAFTLQAAKEICAASPSLLASLFDKSLLLFLNDHYEMLDTFRQYTFGKLEELPDEFRVTVGKYIEYYAEFCLSRDQGLSSSLQRQVLDEMTSEFENIRTAWNWMVMSDHWVMLAKVKQPLLAYLVITGNFIQGRELFHLALVKLKNLNDSSLELIQASMLQLESWMAIRNGFVSEGIPGLFTSLDVFRRLDSEWDVIMSTLFLAEAYRIVGKARQGRKYIEDAIQMMSEIELPGSNYVNSIGAHCQSVFGHILVDMGDFSQAELILKNSLAMHLKIGTYYGSISPLLGLARIASLQGEFIQSRNLYLQALETATHIYDQRGMAVIHNNLGAIYEDLANPIESYHHTLTALKLCKETGDRRLKAVIMNNMAYHQLRYLDHPSDAIRTYHVCIEIFSDLGDLRGVAYTYYDLSKAYLRVGLVKEARDYCLRSLQTAMTLDSNPLILHALHGFAHLFAQSGECERALRMCWLVENHPQVEADTQKRVIVSRVELETRLSPQTIESAKIWGQSTPLQEVIDQVLSE